VDHRVKLVQLVYQEHRVQKVHQGSKALKDNKVSQGHQEMLDLLGRVVM